MGISIEVTGDSNDESSIGTVRWFGPSWGAPVCDPRAHIPTPVRMSCEGCLQEITGDENGVTYPYWDGGTTVVRIAYHRECNLRHVLGCSAQLQGEPCDHEGDYREDALRVEAWVARNG